MTRDDAEARILKELRERSRKPPTARGLWKLSGLFADDYPEFKRIIKHMLDEGTIVRRSDRALLVAGSDDGSSPASTAGKGVIVGVFRRNRKGFGFVRQTGVTDKNKDIYIPVESSGDASTGDVVAVRLKPRSRDRGPNRRGEIVEVRSRASSLFVGTYLELEGSGFVRIDGGTFHDPIYVGDPGAKGAKPGDKATVEIVRYPSAYEGGEGVLIEILGRRGEPGVDTLSIIKSFELPDQFDEATLLEARRRANEFDPEHVSGRLDLRDLPTITIDPVNARDFDDAISLSRDEKGFYTLGVHIADVSWFVEPGSHVDRSARERGTSVYLPDRVLPMIPEVVSNGVASLQAGRTRYAVSVFIEFDPEGRKTDVKFARSAIRVLQRFTYEQAYEIIQHGMMNDSNGEASFDRVAVDLIAPMRELALILRRRRVERGALELDMPEIAVELGDSGEVTGARIVAHDESHRLIEEFMLAANEAAAEFLTERGVGFLRRGHEDPDPLKLLQFAEFVRSLGITIDEPRSRFELQRLLRETASLPEAHAIHYGMLRSLKQARYTPEEIGHYALASDDYCHFTSPIRRYPDLQVHRQILAILAGKKPKSDFDELTVLGDHCTKLERRAEAAERELIRVKLLSYLEPKIGELFHAVVVGVEEFGLFCRLIEFPVEGLLHVAVLDEAESGLDYYIYEPETHSLTSRRKGLRYRLGDRLEVRIARVDVDGRELDLILPHQGVDRVARRGPARRRSGSPPRRFIEPVRERSAVPKKTKAKAKTKAKKKGKKKR